MPDKLSKADELMRKASDLFGRGKTQKAHVAYGKAIQAYRDQGDGRHERIALAHYTRALLVLKGDSTGHAETDLDRGDQAARAVDSPEGRRFRGLFCYLRALLRRQKDEFGEAQGQLDEARALLSQNGRPFDLYEVEREQARLHADCARWDQALEAARKALDRSESPHQVIEARILVSELQVQRGELAEAVRALEAATSHAHDFNLRQKVWELEDRLKLLKKNHPELASSD